MFPDQRADSAYVTPSNKNTIITYAAMFGLLAVGLERELAMPSTEQRTSGRDICRIKDLLRRGNQPTPAEMKELETLLSLTDDTKLRALTSDPRHEPVLTYYIRFLRKRILRIFAGFVAVIAALAIVTLLLTQGQTQ